MAYRYEHREILFNFPFELHAYNDAKVVGALRVDGKETEITRMLDALFLAIPKIGTLPSHLQPLAY